MSLEWTNKPLRELVRLAWPITVSTVSYSVMTLVDTVLVGHLGRAELAGVGLGGVMAFVFLCFSIGLLRGANTLVAQAVGAGRTGDVRALQGAAVGSALLLGVVTIGFGQVAAEILYRFAGSEAAGQAVRTYLRIRILGAPLALLFVAFREVRYGTGDSRSPMRATVVANVVNIALAWTFVYVCRWGVAGAATATVIAHTVEAGMLALPRWREGWGLSSFRSHVRALWRLGAPLGIQFTLEVGSFAVLSLLIAGLSDVDMAAHQIALQLIHFSFLPAFAVSEAGAVLVGQAVGARRFDLPLRVARYALGITTVYTALWTLLLAFAARLIVAGFTTDGAVIDMAVALLHVAAVFQMIDGSSVVARGALRGAGDVRFSAIVGVATSWLCTPPVAWLLGYRFHLGALGGWLGLCLEIFVGAGILWWRLELRRDRWMEAARAVTATERPDGPMKIDGARAVA